MTTATILFSFYLFICVWFFPKLSFLKNSNFSEIQIRLLLTLKIFSGVACAYYFKTSFFVGDHNSINEIGKLQYDLLINNPRLFFNDTTNDFTKYGPGSLFEASNSFWGYLRFSLLFKFVALLNLITKGNFYFNSAIFSSLVFFGHIAFYRLFATIYPGKKYLLLAACFFVPSIWLYTACVHKDGFVFLSLGIISFVFYKMLQPGYAIKAKHILALLTGFIIIFLFRNYVLVALLPAMFTVLLCAIFPLKKKQLITLSYGIYIGLFFLTGLLNNSFNLPQAVVNRKADFANLEEASTQLPMNELSSNVISFAKNIPQAINHTLLRPYLWESKNAGMLLAAGELFLYQVLFLLALISSYKKQNQMQLFTWFAFLFFASMMLIIGYIIPNSGAIMRYRGIVVLFVLCAIVGDIHWEKIKQMLTAKK